MTQPCVSVDAARIVRRGACVGLAAAALLAGSRPAVSDPTEDFYRGKRLSLVIRATPGGNYDSYSRLLGRYITRYLPGNPVAVPVNMPAGGGLVAFNHVMTIAPKDGTVITMITETFPMDQALGLNKSLTIDLRTMNCIGNMSDSSQMLLTRQDSPTKALADAKRRETVIGATGIGSSSTQLVALYNNMLGTRFKIVYGYPSGPEISLAMERGEIEGRSTGTIGSLVLPANADPSLPPFNYLIQAGMRKMPGYEAVPLLREVAPDSDSRAVADFISEAIAVARPVCMAPGVPAERVEAMRRAFDKALADPELLAEAERNGMEIAPMTGEALQAVIRKMIETPPAILDKVRLAIQVTAAERAPGAKKEGAE
jgi:tripartite-type tricarboxylate transporter receptor subunit TctC